MKELLKIIPVVLYLVIGMISLLMAFKGLFSKKFLPFQQQAANKEWQEIDDSLKVLILTFMRLTGLSFLIMSIFMIVFPVVNYFTPNIFFKFSIPVIALIFCTGLFISNYILYKKTNAKSPWKGSIFAMIIIIVGMIISIYT